MVTRGTQGQPSSSQNTPSNQGKGDQQTSYYPDHLRVKEVWRGWVLIEKERPQVRPFFFQVPLNIDWIHYHSSHSRPGKQGHSATLSRGLTGQNSGPEARQAFCFCSIPAPTPPWPVLTPSSDFIYKTFPEVCLCFHPPSPWHCKESNSLQFSAH